MLKKYFLPLLISIFIFSCNGIDYITDESAKLSFSVDTVMFDTVFTTIGSATERLMVHNEHDLPIIITSINLAGGSNSSYRLNIDGIPDNKATEIEIAAHDSMYIFVEVTVDPNRDQMVEQDSIIFVTNGNYQDVDLVAFGQDVNLINGEIIGSQIWTNEKPYLIYNSMLVDTLETLQIEQGTQLYFHQDSYLFVKGSLIVNGTLDLPVTFQGDRLESYYDEGPGQWGGIWLAAGSHDNFINFAKIKNANYGIRIDTLVNPSVPNLTLLNTEIVHHTIAGIYALGTNIVAANCLIADCGVYSVALLLGGNYSFFNCTIANYWKWGPRLGPALALNNYLTYNNIDHYWGHLSASFANCIIWGSQESEFVPDAFNIEGGMSFTFDHCVARVKPEIYQSIQNLFLDCKVNKNFGFKAVEDYDFRLDTLSSAKDSANLQVITNNIGILQFDLEGNDRLIDAGPDIGVYERIE